MTGIVILNYNNIDRTLECINKIDVYCKDITKIVLVDNGSSNHVRATLIENLSKNRGLLNFNYKDIDNVNSNIDLPHISYLQIDENLGYAKGNNAGGELLEKDKSIDYILIQNNDIFYIQDIITPMIKAFDSLSDAMLIAPLKLKRDGITLDENSDRKAPYSYWYFLLGAMFMTRDLFGIRELIDKKNHIDFKTEKGDYIEAGCPHGPCLMFKMSDWKRIKGFDPNTFLFNEEYIMSKRIKDMGGKSYLVRSCKCVHFHGLTTEKQNLYDLAKQHQASTHYYLGKIEKVGALKMAILKFFDNIYLMKLKYLGSLSH